MLIKTRQHWLPRILNIGFTILAWGAFAYLMVDGVGILFYGEPRPKEFALPWEFFDTLHSLLWYLLMACVLSATLLIWAKYNQHRASRYSRRQRIPDITEQQLANSFGVSAQVLEMIHLEQILVLHNDAKGNPSEVSFVGQGYQKLDVRSEKVPTPAAELLAG